MSTCDLAQPRRPLVVLSLHHCRHLPSNDSVGLLRWVEFIVPEEKLVIDSYVWTYRLNSPQEAVCVGTGSDCTSWYCRIVQRVYTGVHAACYIVWRGAIEVVLRVVVHVGKKSVGVKGCCIT